MLFVLSTPNNFHCSETMYMQRLRLCIYPFDCLWVFSCIINCNVSIDDLQLTPAFLRVGFRACHSSSAVSSRPGYLSRSLIHKFSRFMVLVSLSPHVIRAP